MIGLFFLQQQFSNKKVGKAVRHSPNWFDFTPRTALRGIDATKVVIFLEFDECGLKSF